LLLYSKIQIPITAIAKKTIAPKNGLKLKINPKAMPGKATWERASPTKAILFKIAKQPSKLAAAEIKIATNKG